VFADRWDGWQKDGATRGTSSRRASRRSAPMLSRSLRVHFAAAMRRLLRPIVRRMIAYGLTFPAFVQLAKQVYVEVAESEFGLPFKRQTDSRIALVTGIPRKEIASLRRRGAAATAELPEVEETLITHVIGRWMAGPPYATPDGIARRLPYESATPEVASFARLVREIGGDIPVRAVLDELLRIGSATLTSSGDVELCCEAHIPAETAEGRFTLLGTDPGELFTAIAHNIEHPDAPWLQRKVSYDHVGTAGLARLRDEARQAGLDFLRRANALLASYDRDRTADAPSGARTRVAVGVYYYEEPVAPEPEPPATPVATPPPGRIRGRR
jgi:hypothetical protein